MNKRVLRSQISCIPSFAYCLMQRVMLLHAKCHPFTFCIYYMELSAHVTVQAWKASRVRAAAWLLARQQMQAHYMAACG